jgi:hypothetical protein
MSQMAKGLAVGLLIGAVLGAAIGSIASNRFRIATAVLSDNLCFYRFDGLTGATWLALPTGDGLEWHPIPDEVKRRSGSEEGQAIRDGGRTNKRKETWDSPE